MCTEKPMGCAGASSAAGLSALDYLPVFELRALQLRRLQATVRRAFEHVPTYRDRMRALGVEPDDIRDLADIRKLPFTTKSDLLGNYPYGMFACGLDRVVRLHASSGTKSKPIVVGYTEGDLRVWTELMARTLLACGVRCGDVVHNAYSYGLFTGGLGVHQGAEALGATVVPVSTGNTDRQIMLMQDLGSTVVCCTPSYFLHLLDRARELGVEPGQLRLRIGIFGGEPWTEGMRQRIESTAGIKAYDIYGLSEMIGPGVASECCAQAGLHLFEDHFYPEIIDPDTGEVLPDGQEGELVLTTLTKEALPMIRYRTRDITRLISEPCMCGRTLRRIARIRHRSDDMLIIRGVNVFPSQIEEALLAIDGTLPHYQIVVTRESDLDRLEVQVEVTRELFSDTVGALEQLQKRIVHRIESVTGIRVQVRLVEPNTIQRSQGKAKRVIDLRSELAA